MALDRCVVGIAGRLSHTPIDAPDAVVPAVVLAVLPAAMTLPAA